jgi:predicted metalloprotease with PDZ domain
VAPQRTTADASGPGFEVDWRDGKAVVNHVFANSPAEEVGIRVGDELVQMDDHHVPIICSKAYDDSIHAYKLTRAGWSYVVKIASVTMTELFVRATSPVALVAAELLRAHELIHYVAGLSAKYKVQPSPTMPAR